jgi:hypothetical protein
MAKINIKLISAHMSYTILELSGQMRVNPKTVRRWIDDGLPIVPGSESRILLMGHEVKAFLRNKRRKRKIELNRSQFCCFRCKAARYAKRGSITIVGDQKKAICRVCNGKMCRTIKPSQTDYQIPSPPGQMSMSAG